MGYIGRAPTAIIVVEYYLFLLNIIDGDREPVRGSCVRKMSLSFGKTKGNHKCSSLTLKNVIFRQVFSSRRKRGNCCCAFSLRRDENSEGHHVYQRTKITQMLYWLHFDDRGPYKPATGPMRVPRWCFAGYTLGNALPFWRRLGPYCGLAGALLTIF